LQHIQNFVAGIFSSFSEIDRKFHRVDWKAKLQSYFLSIFL